MADRPSESELGLPKRFIIDHNADGKSVFSTAFSEEITPASMPGTLLYDVFVSTEIPVQLNDGADLKAMAELPPAEGLHRPGAIIMRFVDFLPGSPAIMHRTETIDYGVVISGELELILDSGESKTLKAGDSVVQRGTNHAWKNPHPSKPARGLFVMAPSAPLVVNGQEMKENIEWPEP